MEITSGPKVEIELAGALVAIPSQTIAELWLERLQDKGDVLAMPRYPRIGAQGPRGWVFMGVVRGDKGAPDYPLYDLGEAPERMDHAAAKKWAESQGGSLPTRRELAVMFGNRADGQYKEEWYWSIDEYEGAAGCAWLQGFSNGTQLTGRKSIHFRARAVRRLTL